MRTLRSVAVVVLCVSATIVASAQASPRTATVSLPTRPMSSPSASAYFTYPRRVTVVRRVIPVRGDVTTVAHVAARTALIIGINDGDPAHPLMGGVTDAHYMLAALLMHGFERGDVTVLLNGEATRTRIIDELNRLAERTKSGGLAVFAAATHASGQSLRTGDGGRLYATELASHLGRIRGRVWTALAVCYAGRFALPGVTGRDRIATLSSDANNLSYEMGREGSNFFYYLVNLAIVQRAADKSIEEAFDYASMQMGETGSIPPPVMSDGTSGAFTLDP